MARDDERERVIVKYLLGELSGRERDEFEQAYLADDRLFDEVRAVEDELFDDYSRGDLSERRRRLFEQNLLRSPDAARRLRFSRAFDETLSRAQRPAVRAAEPRAASRQADTRPRAFRRKGLILASAAVAVVLTLCGALAFFNARRSARQPAPDNPEQSAQTPNEPTPPARQTPGAEADNAAPGEDRPHDARAQAANAQQSNSRGAQNHAALAFTLRPAGTRGRNSNGGEVVLSIPRAAERVSLRLKVLADEYASYRAVVRTAEGVEVLSAGALRARRSRGGKEVSVEISARSLREGDYTLTLSGLASPGRYEDVDDFYFSVVRR